VPSSHTKQRATKYTYGPVPSRRLGLSLGIDIIPHKNCSFDCIYCQLGRTSNKTLMRKEYTPVEPILDELKHVLSNTNHINYLTFSGSGEPTLHIGIGYLISELKKMTDIPVAVLTNGSLLYMPDVRNDLKNADLVIPTLCSVDQEIFTRIHRSHAGLSINTIIDGYTKFREGFNGEVWLELMLIKDINDTPEQIEKMKSVIDKIKPNKIHLNTVVRPPSEEYAHPVSPTTLQDIKKLLGAKCEIIAEFKSPATKVRNADQLTEILSIIKRRPITLYELAKITGSHENEIIKSIEMLLKQGKIEISKHDQKNYYRIQRGSDD